MENNNKIVVEKYRVKNIYNYVYTIYFKFCIFYIYLKLFDCLQNIIYHIIQLQVIHHLYHSYFSIFFKYMFVQFLFHFFFRNQGGEMLMHIVWDLHPLKPPSSQATRSHPGKARSYEPKALNKTMLREERKVSLFHTPSTGHHQFTP